MPIKIPNGLPARETLEGENIFLMPETRAKTQEIRPLRIEGYATSNWVLMDYGSVVVHLFQREARAFYDLERLWKDGKQLETADFIEVRGND